MQIWILYSLVHLVVPKMEMLISRTLLCLFKIRLLFQGRVRSQNVRLAVFTTINFSFNPAHPLKLKDAPDCTWLENPPNYCCPHPGADPLRAHQRPLPSPGRLPRHQRSDGRLQKCELFYKIFFYKNVSFFIKSFFLQKCELFFIKSFFLAKCSSFLGITPITGASHLVEVDVVADNGGWFAPGNSIYTILLGQ